MIPARDCAPRALGEMLRGQPLSKAKIRFAWHTSVGASMARATSVELDPTGTLYVRTDSEHWRRETIRSAGVIKQRLAALLGQHIVKRVTVESKRLIMRASVIVSAVRVPTGKFLGKLKSLPATELGSRVIREAVSRAHIEASEVDECIMGNVVPAGLGQAPARQAALGGGLPDHVGALTINKVCGSGLKAVMLAAQGIATGDIDVAVAGGMESMSNCPYLLLKAREGMRMGNAEVIDSMIHDGLWCSLENWSMGLACEAVADTYHVSREDQDAFAAASHQKAEKAIRDCWFKDEILPVEIPQRKGDPIRLEYDESVRPDSSVEALARLKPAFKKGGSVTAGNAPGVNDGAAAVVVMAAEKASVLGVTPMARIVGQAVSGLAPKWILMTPVQAVHKLLRKVDWTLEDVDLIELNEAFSAQALAVIRELGADPAKVNVNGGAVALGHPIGASGARILTTLLYALRRRNLKRGIATLCLGGGNGVALAVEAL